MKISGFIALIVATVIAGLIIHYLTKNEKLIGDEKDGV